jgi:ComF family protein
MSHHGIWCEYCDKTLPYLSPAHCPNCALPTLLGEVCGHCLKKPPAFTHTSAVFSYQFPIDRLILAFKYHEQLALAQIFSEKLLQNIGQNDLPDYVIPMPLHPAKLRSRGFNQAKLIATPLARALHLPQLACRRLRDTPSQTSLPWHERSNNVRGAFSCDIDLSGKHIALVDDVFTTGASLNELAVAVKSRGANRVSAWVVARTIKNTG